MYVKILCFFRERTKEHMGASVALPCASSRAPPKSISLCDVLPCSRIGGVPVEHTDKDLPKIRDGDDFNVKSQVTSALYCS